jgi:autotransporter-associated beta strand protein
MRIQRESQGSLSRALAHRRFAATAAAASVVWLAFQAGVAQAADGSWILNNAGNWSTSINWFGSPNPVPGGAGSTVWLTNNITAARTVTIDTVGSRTVGVLNIGSGNGLYAFTLAAGTGMTLTFDNSGSNARLNQISTSTNSTISAPLQLNSPLDITNESGNTLTLSGTITNLSESVMTINNQGTGSGGVTISGAIRNSAEQISVTQNSSTSKLTLSVGVTGSGDLILQNNSTTPGAITLSGTSINNSGRFINSGSGTGSVTNSAVIGVNVTGVIQNSTNSPLIISSGTHTYSGTTTINAGILVVGGGTINNTTNIVIMAGATFDVSALASGFSVASGKRLTCGSTSGTAIVNATGRTLTLATGALLAFQADGTSGTVGKMVVTNILALNINVVTVNVNGSTLAQGTYRLLECTGTLTGVAGGDAVMTGTPLSNGCFGFIQTTAGAAGYVELVVMKAPVFTGGSYDGFDSRSFLNNEITKKKGTLIRVF